MAGERKRYYRPRASLTFNMAPMIDIVFLLIIFFVLVGTFASAEHIRMDLPGPDQSQAQNQKISDRAIINIQLINPDDSQSPVVFSIGPNPPEPLEMIDQRLAANKTAFPDLKVIIRADKRVRYADVRSVMEIVADNNIEMMNIAALLGPHAPAN